mgnify:CR=1 FL=1
MSHADPYRIARESIRKGHAHELLELSGELVRSENSALHPSGYLMRGMAYEIGSEELDVDLERAAASYRKAVSLAPDTITYLFLARALMKMGGDQRLGALRYIQEAEAIRMEPEVSLAYARYYECARQDYRMARRHYRDAALAGRFPGFFGYAAMSRKLKQPGIALAVDALRILLGPVLFLLLGTRASKGL